MSTLGVHQFLARANAALALRRWNEAEQAARGALAIDPGSEGGSALLSRALTAQGRYSEAIATAEKGLFSNPASEWLHRVHSLAYFEAGRHSEALRAADEAVRVLPDNGPGHHLRSLALNRLGRLSEAREAAKRAVALSPDMPEIHAQLGDTWLTEDPSAAEVHYRASLAISPTQPLVLNNLGVALLRQRRRGEAALAFKSALLVDPSASLPKRNVFVASAAVIRASPLGWFGILLSVPVIALALISGSLHGSAFAVTFGSAGAILAVQLAVLSRARRIGLQRLEQLDPQLHAIRLNLEGDLKSGRLVFHSRGLRWFGKALAAFGAATVLGSLTGEVFVVRQYLDFPERPRRVTVEAAQPHEWVQLEGATLDCDSRREIRGNVYFVGRSSGGRSFVASYSGSVTCDRAQSELRGVISELNPRLAKTLVESGFVVPAGHPSALCASCGPGATLAGTAILLLGMVLGAYLAWEGLKMRRPAPLQQPI